MISYYGMSYITHRHTHKVNNCIVMLQQQMHLKLLHDFLKENRCCVLQDVRYGFDAHCDKTELRYDSRASAP